MKCSDTNTREGSKSKKNFFIYNLALYSAERAFDDFFHSSKCEGKSRFDKVICSFLH